MTNSISALLGLALYFALSTLAIPSSTARADDTSTQNVRQDVDVRVEVPLEAALIPARGYDDNDAVEVILHGRLPNTCYSLESSEIEHGDGNTLRVRQFAIMSNGGHCYDKSTMPPYLKMPVQFTTSVRIGRLVRGNYTLQYQRDEGAPAERGFQVDVALSPNVDNLPYAPVTQVTARDFFNGTEEVKITFSGVLPSDCVELAPEIKVEREDDVFVILPTIRPIEHDPKGGFCETVYLPFQRTINLGKLPHGHFLAHIRSMAGNSANKVFEVMR